MAVSVKPHVEAALRSFNKHYEKVGSVPLTALLDNGFVVSGMAVLEGNKGDAIHGLFSSVTEALLADAISLRVHVQYSVDYDKGMQFGVPGSYVFIDLPSISAVQLLADDFHGVAPDDGVDASVADDLDVVPAEPAAPGAGV